MWICTLIHKSIFFFLIKKENLLRRERNISNVKADRVVLLCPLRSFLSCCPKRSLWQEMKQRRRQVSMKGWGLRSEARGEES